MQHRVRKQGQKVTGGEDTSFTLGPGLNPPTGHNPQNVRKRHVVGDRLSGAPHPITPQDMLRIVSPWYKRGVVRGQLLSDTTTFNLCSHSQHTNTALQPEPTHTANSHAFQGMPAASFTVLHTAQLWLR
jgi:hypothetical protein